jgi:hypothetical protein
MPLSAVGEDIDQTGRRLEKRQLAADCAGRCVADGVQSLRFAITSSQDEPGALTEAVIHRRRIA